jgi:hypothetical protein
MPIRGSSSGARHTRPQARRDGRDRPEQVVVIDWNEWSSSIGTGGRHHPVRANVTVELAPLSAYDELARVTPAHALQVAA